jgi:hypothetical protein
VIYELAHAQAREDEPDPGKDDPDSPLPPDAGKNPFKG